MPIRRLYDQGRAALMIALGRRLHVVDRYAYALTTLGITEPALADLERLTRWNRPPAYRLRAAEPLALWYANQGPAHTLPRALDLLRFMARRAPRGALARETAVMQAECLRRTGRGSEADAVLRSRLAREPHVDLWLALASAAGTPDEKAARINPGLAHCGLAPLELRPDTGRAPFDRLAAGPLPRPREAPPPRRPRVSVIVPACDAAHTIGTALRSLSAQTWGELEIIVSDDGSRDGTPSVVRERLRADPRIRLVTSRVRAGPWAACSRALAHCTGEFVALSGADAWSHPQRIAIQAAHLLASPRAVGNLAEEVHVLEDLSFSRQFSFGRYSRHGPASLLFRREPVRRSLGCWDPVWHGGDAEFLLRVERVFGPESVPRLPTGPVQWIRHAGPPPPPGDPLACRGFDYGARRAYLEAARAFHEKSTPERLRYRFPAAERPFPAPRCVAETPAPGPRPRRRHLDVVIASEFRFPGGTSTSNAQEIKAQRAAGLRTGLVQLSRYRQANRDMNPDIRGLIDGRGVQEVVYGERVSCDLLIVKHPTVLHHAQRFVPDVEARHAVVVVNQTPRASYDGHGQAEYHIPRCQANFRSFFHREALWYAVGPSVRESLLRHHAREIRSLRLADTYWHELIDVADWQRTGHRVDPDRPSIGRHTRDHPTKWPGRKKDLLAVYPDSGRYQVRILGGAGHARKILGTLPSNWRVNAYGSVPPADFLRQLDVFVYYPREDMVEAFGRSILEALATGVPVVLPPRFRATFGEAALYAEPQEALACVDALVRDPAYYRERVQAGWDHVSAHFGSRRHLARIQPYLRRKLGGRGPPRGAVTGEAPGR